MPNYTHHTGNGFETKTFFRRPTTNATRHIWQADCCKTCGITRTRQLENGRISSYYTDKNGKPIGHRVPECKS